MSNTTELEPQAASVAKSSQPGGKNPYYFYPDPYAAYMDHESLYNYRPGGFHPINLGDALHDGRYVIRHKLGHGGFSTVWLARDTQEEYVSRLINHTTLTLTTSTQEMGLH